MRSSCLIHPCRRFRWVRIAFVTILTLLFCGWNNCTAIIGFNSCPSTVPQPVIVSVLFIEPIARSYSRDRSVAG